MPLLHYFFKKYLLSFWKVSVCDTLAGFGPAAKSAVAALTALSEDLRTGKRDAPSEKRRIEILRKIEKTIKTIKSASKLPVNPATNQVPRQVLQGRNELS